MKKMRKYSGATGLKAVPNIPNTFVPRSSPHFVAALSGKGHEQPQRKTSVYKNPTPALTQPAKKHSIIFRSQLPMIQVTAEGAEDRSWHVQRKVSSSNSPLGTRAGLNSFDNNEGNASAPNATKRQRKTSVKGRGVVLGETPLGKDVLFRRKISNTAAPKVDKAEEKERLLLKYTPLNNNAAQTNTCKRRMKNMYFSRHNIQTDSGKSNNVFPSLSKRSGGDELDANCTARSRTQSLNFAPKSDVTHMKEKTTKEVLTSKTFPGDPGTSDVYSRSRTQSLNFVIQRSAESSAESAKTRAMKDKTKEFFEIIEEKSRKQNPTLELERNNLLFKPGVKTNHLSATLFLRPQKEVMDNVFDGLLTPTRDQVSMTPSRKVSHDRNAFLAFPYLRGNSWIEN